MTDDKDDILERAFEAARRAAPVSEAELLDRVLTDAYAAQADFTSFAPKPSLWSRFKLELGGWPGMAGLSTAALAGVWIGVSPPNGMVTAAQNVIGSGTEAGYVVDLGADDWLGLSEGAL